MPSLFISDWKIVVTAFFTHCIGVHATRRSVVTELFRVENLKEISIRRFMRRGLGTGLGVLPRYVKVPVETTGIEVLEKHPYVKVWEELFPLTR